MKDLSVGLAGVIDDWPTKEEMASLLEDAGLSINVGKYSIRIQDCSHFVFQEYGGDLGGPCIDADAENTEDMIKCATLVSNALKKSNIGHSFEVYDHKEELVSKIEYKKNA